MAGGSESRISVMRYISANKLPSLLRKRLGDFNQARNFFFCLEDPGFEAFPDSFLICPPQPICAGEWTIIREGLGDIDLIH